jgi:hypothetical protein
MFLYQLPMACPRSPAHVGRTPATGCEAVPAVSRQRGHEAAPLVWCLRTQPGAVQSLVSLIASRATANPSPLRVLA